MLFRANNRSSVLDRIHHVGVPQHRGPAVRGLTMADHLPFCLPELRPKFFIGLDLGQVSDFSALCVLKATPTRTSIGIVNNYDCVHLHRFPLSTSYPAIARAVSELAGRAELRPWYTGRLKPRRGVELSRVGVPTICLDATGVGTAVI